MHQITSSPPNEWTVVHEDVLPSLHLELAHLQRNSLPGPSFSAQAVGYFRMLSFDEYGSYAITTLVECLQGSDDSHEVVGPYAPVHV
jgi:hypothetical protein